MSSYSGKCDFADYIFMSSEDLTDEQLFDRFNGTKLYKYKPKEQCVDIENIEDMKLNWEEIKYSSIKDLIPYYPYIVCLSCRDNTDNNNSMVVLSSESYVDEEERETLEYMLKSVLTYYNRSKRKKEPFDKSVVLSKICHNHYNEDIYKELINRVEKYGKKASTDGIELQMSKYYRDNLRKEIEKYENY